MFHRKSKENLFISLETCRPPTQQLAGASPSGLRRFSSRSVAQDHQARTRSDATARLGSRMDEDNDDQGWGRDGA